MSISRRHDIEDTALDRQIADYQVKLVGDEDGPMLDAINAEMHGAELMDLKPVVLQTDRGAMQVRRVMKRLLRQEAEQREAGRPVESAVHVVSAAE